MAYLVDTDQVISALAGDAATVALVRRLMPGGVSMSIVTYMEAYDGVVRRDSAAAAAQLAAFSETVPVLDFSRAIAERCARIRARLAGEGRRVRGRSLDLMTAAVAIEHGLTLVTRNIADYRDIPGLELFSFDV